MFAVWCNRHRARVLLDSSNIVQVTNTDRGIDVEWQCSCGAFGRGLHGRPPRIPHRFAQSRC